MRDWKVLVILPVEVITGLIFAYLERASMHSSLLMFNTMHSSIRCCTCVVCTLIISLITITITKQSEREREREYLVDILCRRFRSHDSKLQSFDVWANLEKILVIKEKWGRNNEVRKKTWKKKKKEMSLKGGEKQKKRKGK